MSQFKNIEELANTGGFSYYKTKESAPGGIFDKKDGEIHAIDYAKNEGYEIGNKFRVSSKNGEYDAGIQGIIFRFNHLIFISDKYRPANHWFYPSQIIERLN